MIDTSRKQIQNKQGRSGTTVHGCGAFLFSLPFMGAGGFVMLLGLGIIPIEIEDKELPPFGIVLFGSIFFLAGFSIFVHAIKGAVRNVRRKRIMAENPDAYWMADHAWDPRGSRDNPLGRMIKTIMAGIFVSLFLSLFNYFIFFGDKAPGFAKIVILLFDIAPIAIFGYAIYLFIRYLKYGIAYITFDTFPYFSGNQVAVHFGTTRSIGQVNTISFTLRHIEEVFETHGSGKNRSQVVVCYQTWAETHEFTDGGNVDPSTEPIPLTFDIPRDAKGTNLTDRPPHYWELEIAADTPGVDFKAVLLVPVYSESITDNR